MKILFAAAGTAGHVNPAIAMAQMLKEHHPDAEFLFLVTPNGMEKGLIEKAGYPTYVLDVRGIQRRLTLENLRALHLFFRAGKAARALLREWQPDLIIGTGGYMSFPAVEAGKRLHIPCVLHESNAVPGLAVRLLAGKADLVLGGFPDITEHLSKKCRFYYVGTPVRHEFRKVSRAVARASIGVQDGEFLLVTVGGSLGAKQLSQTAIKCFEALYRGRNNYRMILSTGKRFYDEMRLVADQMPLSGNALTLAPYIDNMAAVLSAADLVISRGGAATITELSAVAVPSIIVPYPAATGDHQTKNARALESLGACLVIPESELTAERLESEISNLVKNPERLRHMRNATRILRPKTSEDSIIKLLDSLLT